MKSDNRWFEWARELQFLAQSALAYCKDVYDIERFQRIREISAEMTADLMDMPVEKAHGLFCNETGYQTPKLDTRAAVIRDGRILLVQERDGSWALPGGWVDYDQTVRSNAAKEVLEEAGMVVEPLRLIALQDHNRHHVVKAAHEICSTFVLCEYRSGEFRPNVETVGCGWFSAGALPEPLAPGKTTREQILMCLEAAKDPAWVVRFD